MTPIIDHVQVTVSDLDRALPFYDLLLGQLGFHVEAKVRARIEAHDFEVVEYPHPTLAFAISCPRTAFLKETAHRRKPGALHHLAFKASSRAEVDRLARALEDGGAVMAGGPCLWPQHGEDYYAVFVKDPDGLKYEIVHCPHPHV